MITNGNTIINVCRKCGCSFIIRKRRISGKRISMYCSYCWNEIIEQKKRESEELIRFEKMKKQAEEKKIFENRIKSFSTVSLGEIANDDNNTLIILGNGFDLMHGVKSSYYDFRDSLGKHNKLRSTLEDYLDSDDIWSDFEVSLAHINVSRMAHSAVVETMLDFFDGYDPYESTANYYAAIDAAASPMDIIISELPKKFRQWVIKLSFGTDDTPLKRIIHQPYVLCFNYTEFIESIYKVNHDNVCYIHGNRNYKNEPLILGHLPDASDDMYRFDYNNENPFIKMTQEMIIYKISDADNDLTKNCIENLEKHKSFFSKLKKINKIIVIGHSLSEVDMVYFSAIIKQNDCPDKIQWYFSCYGNKDLDSIIKFTEKLKIIDSHIKIFRTDILKINYKEISKQNSKTTEKYKKICESNNKKHQVMVSGRKLRIINSNNAYGLFQILPFFPSFAFFSNNNKHLFVIDKGYDGGILIYNQDKNNWKLADEMYVSQDSLINPRLRKVILNKNIITFVYNNRIREFNLSNGTLEKNIKRTNARFAKYKGEDLTELFFNTNKHRKKY